MADIERLRKNLEDRGIRSSYFATAQAAADYLDRQIDGTTVGIGGSMTVKAMGLYPPSVCPQPGGVALGGGQPGGGGRN